MRPKQTMPTQPLKPVVGALLLAPGLTLAQGTAPTTAPTAAAPAQTVEIIGRLLRNPFAESTFSVTGVQTDILDVPQSVSAVTKEVIREQGLLRLNDIVPFVAGVNEFSVYDDITIRDFRNFDDRRVNGLRTYNSFWKQPQIAHLERVEVIKGPASALFGDASPGGTINLVTKKPLATTRREAELRLGSFSERYATVDLTGPVDANGRLLYRFNASVEDSGSFRNQAFNKGWLVAPSFTWVASDRTRVNLDLVHIDDRSVLDRGQPNLDGATQLGAVPAEVMVTQPGDALDTTDTSLALNVEHRLSEDWSVSASLMRYRYREKLLEHSLNFYITPNLIELDATDRDTRADTSNLALRTAGRFMLGGVEHQLVGGMEQAQRDDANTQNLYAGSGVGTFDLLNPEYRARDFSAYSYDNFLFDGALRTQAVFVSDTLNLGPWQLLLGLRHQRYTTSSSDYEAQRDSVTLPRAGVVRKFGASASAYAIYTEGYQPPDPYVNNPAFGGPFKPEDSRLIEVGWKQRAFGDRLLFTAALYEIIKNNIVVYEGTVAGVDVYRQRGQERARGVEIELNGRVTAALQLLANLAYNDAIISREADPSLVGLTKENAPKWTGSLFARYELGGGWGVGGGVSHVSVRETFDRSLRLPAYTVGNVSLHWRGDRVTLQAAVDNVGDKVHWTGGYNLGRVFPGTPRRARVSASLRF
jgi:iron complex outermembrane recepter protein